MEVFCWGKVLAFQFPYDEIDNERMKACPKRRFNKSEKHWEFPPLLDCMDFVKGMFPKAEWSKGAQETYDQVKTEMDYRAAVSRGEVDFSAAVTVPMRRVPYEHQRKALVMGRDQAVFAYLMEQGTGKSKVLLDDAAHNFRLGRINALLIICPNSVKTNWVNADGEDEVSKDLAPDIPFAKAAWFSDMKKSRQHEFDKMLAFPGLKILSTNIESIAIAKNFAVMEKFCQNNSVMIAVDESTRIKNRTAKRSKAAKKLRLLCEYARILSGTPLIKSPLNAYSQFDFLDPNILNIATYTEFAARHAMMDKSGRFPVRYFNLDELTAKVAGCSYRVTKDDCLDLPPKVYTKRQVNMTVEQAKHYAELRHQMITWLDAQHSVTATTVLSQMTRLQQVTAGYLPIINEDTGETIDLQKIACPKIDETMDIIDELSGKFIIWCRFKFEVREMGAALKAAGVRHVVFDGSTSEADRVTARTSFNEDERIRGFVGQINTGGIGITLNAATTVIYLSNTFNTEDRVQSEDRCHRIGQRQSVHYIDLISPKTLDERVIVVLRENKRISDEIMRDGFKKWL